MKTRKLNVVSILIFVVLIGVIAAGFWIFKSDPEPPELMFIAKPLVNTKEWSSINQNFHAPTAMRWINDEEVVFLEKQPNGPYFIYRQKVLPVGQAGERTLIPNATIPTDASIPSSGLNSKNGLVWILASSQSANAIRKFQLANPHKKFTPTRQVGVTLLDRTQSDSSTVQMNDSTSLAFPIHRNHHK